MLIGAILVFIALIPFLGGPIWRKLTIKAVNASLFERTKALVEKNPQLQSDWAEAMKDGTLTLSEANAILVKGGEKAEPEN
jgi:hypothetical protein